MRNEHVLPKDIIPDHLCANDTGNYLARIQANAYVQVIQQGILESMALFRHNLDHLMRHLEQVVGLRDRIFRRSLFPGYFAFVADSHVSVPKRVHFVDAILLAQIVKLAIKSD